MQNIKDVIIAREFLSWSKEPKEKSFINNALEIARNGSSLSSVINEFYIESISILEDNITHYYGKIEKSNRIEAERAAQRRAEEKRIASGTINWDESYEPSGELKSVGFFSLDGYTHEKDGQITTQEGKRIYYNIFYDTN